MPVGRIVPVGLVGIITGMFLLSRVDGTTSYWGYIIPVLFLMGLGMGGTMMPIMTSAIKTLTAHQVARGSTLINIAQQIASSVGVAIMSVVLTNGLTNDKLISEAGAFKVASEHVTDPAQMQKLLEDFPQVAQILAKFGTDQAAGAAALAGQVQEAMGKVFGHSFLVAAFLVLLTLIPAWFLPRKQEESHLLDEDDAPQAQVFIH